MIKEIEYQLSLGADTLLEGDRFLIECNLDDLATSSGESQEYWSLAIRAPGRSHAYAHQLMTGNRADQENNSNGHNILTSANTTYSTCSTPLHGS